MVEVHELTSTDNPEYLEAVRIYETAYPPEQRIEPDYFIRSMASSEDTADPYERRQFLVSREGEHVNGMATFTYHPMAQLGFLCYLAGDPRRPEPTVEEALYADVLRRIREEPESEEKPAIGCVVEMDRPEEATSREEAQQLKAQIDQLVSRGWTLLANVDYHMPPFREGEGESSIPMWLMFRPLQDTEVDPATVAHVVRTVYRDVYGLTETDPLVLQALKDLDK